MAIDYSRFLPEVSDASDLVRGTMNEIEKHLVTTGFGLTVPEAASKEFLHPDYMKGRFYFQRIWSELLKSLDVVQKLDANLAKGTSINTQIIYDEISLRQRKLFEALVTIIMFARPVLYANKMHRFYFLNFHLNQDKERFTKRNVDLESFFGGKCPEVTALIAKIDGQLTDIASKIDPNNCTWNRDERAKFLNVLPDSTILEQVALGFGYQAVFGSASSQIHLNMSGFFEPTTNERMFLAKIENLLLLAICIVLRAIEIFILTGGKLDSAAQKLQSEFSGAFPNSYAMSVLGAAEKGDIISVFATPDNFSALVIDKRTNGRYSAYEVEPLHKPGQSTLTIRRDGTATLTVNHQVGRRGWFGDIETKLLVRNAAQLEIVKQAIEDKYTDKTNPVDVLTEVFRTEEGFQKYIHERMKKTHLPELFFVQRMLNRGA